MVLIEICWYWLSQVFISTLLVEPSFHQYCTGWQNNYLQHWLNTMYIIFILKHGCYCHVIDCLFVLCTWNNHWMLVFYFNFALLTKMVLNLTFSYSLNAKQINQLFLLGTDHGVTTCVDHDFTQDDECSRSRCSKGKTESKCFVNRILYFKRRH